MNKLYKVGIYCRLSVDDASNSAKAKSYIPADESVSIENQRELLSKFAMLNGWVETKTYCDDGYSGGNFQRPGFLEMLERNPAAPVQQYKSLSANNPHTACLYILRHTSLEFLAGRQPARGIPPRLTQNLRAQSAHVLFADRL